MRNTRSMVDQNIKFEANLFVANFLNTNVGSNREELNQFLNFAVQQAARRAAVRTLTEELAKFIEDNIKACLPPHSLGYIRNLDFELQTVGIASAAAVSLFKKQAAETTDKKWNGWTAVCNSVHRKLNGRVLTCKGNDYRIVKRRNVLYITELGATHE